jgi:hypothetical protein
VDSRMAECEAWGRGRGRGRGRLSTRRVRVRAGEGGKDGLPAGEGWRWRTGDELHATAGREEESTFACAEGLEGLGRGLRLRLGTRAPCEQNVAKAKGPARGDGDRQLRQASAGGGRSALSFRCPAPTCHWAGCSTSTKCVLRPASCCGLSAGIWIAATPQRRWRD